MKQPVQAHRTGRDYGGGHSGGGYVDCEGVDIGLLLTAVLGIGVGFFTLFTKITMIVGGGRKKRDLPTSTSKESTFERIINEMHDVLYGGTILQ